ILPPGHEQDVQSSRLIASTELLQSPALLARPGHRAGHVLLHLFSRAWGKVIEIVDRPIRCEGTKSQTGLGLDCLKYFWPLLLPRNSERAWPLLLTHYQLRAALFRDDHVTPQKSGWPPNPSLRR